ncbi:hypothetical protein GCM10009765_11330 [Fodinicola feengrottensis]|uniref:Peptidase C51 domain-containing protein n=1 Tax=Fodinicola feengrottensis TaxID=435914 RepID=A0ABN2G241_9ACTN
MLMTGLLVSATASPAAATTSTGIASLANANVGGMACAANSLGGHSFYTSCTGNGGQPEYWCADFAKWVWANSGVADLSGLNPLARSFYTYGTSRGIVTSTPAVGDAVVFSNVKGDTSADSNGIHHVAIVTAVSGGTIETVSGDWGGQSGTEAHFASTSHVIHNTPAYGSAVGTYSSVMDMWIEGYIPPPGVVTVSPGEGSQAMVIANGQQHFFADDASGSAGHWFWNPVNNAITHDIWMTSIVGEPTSDAADNGQQHLWARGSDGSLQHAYWDSATPSVINHNVWAPAGSITGDPASIIIGDQQHTFATDSSGSLQHWFFDESQNTITHDTWATNAGLVGRPTILVDDTGIQHVFARGTDGSLQHFWWTPSDNTIRHESWAPAGSIASDPTSVFIGRQQHIFAIDSAGSLQHWFFDEGPSIMTHDTWATSAAITGRPSIMVDDTGAQHVLARGTDGSLQHFWWTPADDTIRHDSWAAAGSITTDPTASFIGRQQHAWATDKNHAVQHWFWNETTNAMTHDTWST